MNRRRFYRSEPAAAVALSFRVGDVTTAGQLADVSGGGARWFVEDEVARHIAVGSTGTLVLFPGQALELPLASRIVRRQPAGERTEIACNFLDANAVHGLLHPEMARLLNRRGGWRLPPDPRRPVGVVVVPAGHTGVPFERARLVDLSIGGACVELPGDFDLALAGEDAVRCVLRLPDDGPPLDLPAHIVHRTLQSTGHLHYGLHFDDVDPRVTAWCLDRQRTVMRETWSGCG